MTSADPGYRALREAAAWLDLSGRGVIRVTGQDRARLLHALATNHVEQLQPGQGCYAFFLNAQGHILADVNVLRFAESLVLDTEPETARRVYEHVDRYIIADDVTLEDLTAETAVLGLEGPQAAAVLAAVGAPVAEAPGRHAEWEDSVVARLSSTGAPGWRIFAPLGDRLRLIGQLERAGAVSATSEAARVVRLEIGTPRYGDDFSDLHLPQETQLPEAVHFNKGCYLGQEIVERIRSRGHVHRVLMRLQVEATEPPPAGSQVFAGEKAVGEITSAVFSPARGQVVALGYLRLDDLTPGVPLAVAGVAVVILARRPAEISAPKEGT
jgi:folate-binding protein YgfZ